MLKIITLMSNSESKKKYGLVIDKDQVAEVTIYTSLYSWDVTFKSKDDMVNYKDEVFKIIKEKLI